jgi:hypothetical protein
MFYKTVFIILFSGLLLSASACSDDGEAKSDNETNKVAETNSENSLGEKEAEGLVEKELNIRMVDAESGLKMRVKPTLEGKVICVLPYGERVNLLYEEGEEMTIGGKTGVWSRVQWREAKGWVFGGFLTESIIGIISIDGEEYEVELYKGTKEELIAMKNDESKSSYLFKYDRVVLVGYSYTVCSVGPGCDMERGDIVFETDYMLTFIPDTEPIAPIMSDGPCERIIEDKTTFKIWTLKDNPDFVIFHSDTFILIIRNRDEIKRIDPGNYKSKDFIQVLEKLNEDGVPYSFNFIRSAKDNEQNGVVISQSGISHLFSNTNYRLNLGMTKPDNIPEDKIFGLFKTRLPDFIFYKIVEVIAVSGEERTTLMSMMHPGGELSIPYILDDNAEIIVLVDGEQRIKEKVKAYKM